MSSIVNQLLSLHSKTIQCHKEIQVSEMELSLGATWHVYQPEQPRVVIRGMKKHVLEWLGRNAEFLT